MKKLSIISVILIIAGILVAASPLIGQWYTNYQENKLINEWLDNEDSAATGSTEASNPEEAYAGLQDIFASEGTDNTDTAEVQPSDSPAAAATEKPAPAPKPGKPASPQIVLGIIRIDKIDVKAPIVEGVEASNLKVGIGHIPGTAALGQAGNSALAGHRSYTFGKFFNRLDELVVGDEIRITTKKEDLVYKVYEKLVVTPDDVSVLKGDKDKNIITLITCTPIYVASHRLIIHASLVERVLKQP